MISERNFASNFNEFWARSLPLLTPRFVNVFNQNYCEQIIGENGYPLEPIDLPIEVENSAVVSELGFYIAKFITEEKASDYSHASIQDVLDNAVASAIGSVRRFNSNSIADDYSINETEIDQGVNLAKRYDLLFQTPGMNEELNFSPTISGAGYLSECEADLSTADSLLEVKTVSRNFSGNDIRQLFTYLALQASTGDRRWAKAGFFNPRRGKYSHFEIDPLLAWLSGGKTSIEFFDELITFISSREFELDSVF